jgi:hypothetical protein
MPLGVGVLVTISQPVEDRSFALLDAFEQFRSTCLAPDQIADSHARRRPLALLGDVTVMKIALPSA